MAAIENATMATAKPIQRGPAPRLIRHDNKKIAASDAMNARVNQSTSLGRGQSSRLRPNSTTINPGAHGRSFHAVVLQWEHDTNRSVYAAMTMNGAYTASPESPAALFQEMTAILLMLLTLPPNDPKLSHAAQKRK
jgi:hypothetical protein